jgi:hypothetical protein
MAQRVRTILISDLSGDEVESGGESIPFSYRGVDYTIDLTAKEAKGFDKAIAMYIEHASKSASKSARARPGRPSSRSGTHHAERIGNMKKWAADQGIDYPKRGRLPKSLIEAYDAAH